MNSELFAHRLAHRRGAPTVLGAKRTLVLAAVVVLSAVSCSGETDQRVVVVVDDTAIVSPLNHLIGVAAADTGALDGRAAEETLAECMALAGFNYEPVDVPVAPSLLAASGIPTRDNVANSGYGFSDDIEFELAQQNAAPLIDPNEAFRDALSPAELAAYDFAISGIDPAEIIWSDQGPVGTKTGEAIPMDEFQKASENGCLFHAYGSSISEDAAELLSSDAYLELQQRFSSDNRMVALINQWSACMSTQGYAYQSPEQAAADAADQASVLYAELTETTVTADPATITQQIDQLRTDEIQIALTDWDCSTELFAQAPQINRELEVEFILANEGDILEILDAKANRQ